MDEADYATFLHQIGQILNITLKPDALNTCKIHYPESQIELFLEMDQKSADLILGAEITSVPPGRFRQDLLEQALKANYLDKPIDAVLGFAPKTDMLSAFLKIPSEHISPEYVAERIPPFLEKVHAWKEHIASNTLPPLKNPTVPTQGPSGMFGLTS